MHRLFDMMAPQVSDCLRRGCALPPPTTAFRHHTLPADASNHKRVGHGAGKVSRAAAACAACIHGL